MFRQWTWNLDRTSSRQSFITLVPWPLSWTIIKQKGTNIDLENYWKNRLGGPNFRRHVKFTYFHPIGGPNFEPSPLVRAKLRIFATTRPLELRNTASWEAPHKTPGRLNHSKGPKPPIYYTPITRSSSELTFTKTGKINQIKPQRLVYRHIKGRKTFTYPVLWQTIQEITFKLVKSSIFNQQFNKPRPPLRPPRPRRLSYRLSATDNLENPVDFGLYHNLGLVFCE